MDISGVPFVSPQTSTSYTNDKPVSISDLPTTTTNAIPISQSQNISTSSVVTSNNSNHTYQSQLQPSSTPNYTHRNNPPGLTKLYHEDTQVFIIEKYCRPVSDTFSTLELGCKFTRDCVVSKTKTLGRGRVIEELSETVYDNQAGSTKKYKYKTVDTRLVNCFNKVCKSTNPKLPKCFHYVCYKHMMESQTDDNPMKELQVESENDKIVDHLIKGIKIKDIQNRILLHDDDTNLIFPICGKRCYNTVTFNRNRNKY